MLEWDVVEGVER
jgi:hypothetical protein